MTDAHLNIAPYKEAIIQGQLIITANNRLANHILRAHLNSIADSEFTVAYRPRVYSLPDWITRLWQQLQCKGYPLSAVNIIQPHLRLMLWESIINHSSYGAELLVTEALAPSVDAALRNLELWQLNEDDVKKSEFLTSSSSLASNHFADPKTNTQVWLSWLAEFRTKLKQKKLITQEEAIKRLVDAFSKGVLPQKTIINLSGFDDIPPLHFALLSAATSHINPLQKMQKKSVLQSTQAKDTEDEMRAAALWAKQQLEKNPAAVIGIVVPNLGQCRAQIERIFTQVFEPLAALPEQASYTLPFNFSAGTPLSQTPIIAACLDLLELQKGEWALDAICHLLMSPFFGNLDREWILRSHLTDKLRKLGKFIITRSDLLYHSQQLESKFYSTAMDNTDAPSLTRLFIQLENQRRTSLGKHNARFWVVYFQELLHNFGWPGNRRLNSKEHQQVALWNQILDHFLQCDSLSIDLSYVQAIQQLRKIASRTPFQAQTPYSPIQILGALEASGLEFSHCWVMGLNDRQWPPQAAPNPFLPLNLQRHHKMPHASAERELTFAQTLTTHYQHCAEHLVLSFAEMQEDTPVNPSRLIQAIDFIPLQNIIGCQLTTWEENLQTITNHSVLEIVDVATAPPVDQRKEFVRGGANLFKEQAICPFNAFARLRLGAVRIDPPQLGFSAIDRGNLLHVALADFWRKTLSQTNLLSLSSSALEQEVVESVRHALSQFKYKLSSGLGSYYLELESFRLNELLQRWLAEEKKRPPFTVIAIEEEVSIEYAGLPLILRIDRIDQLDNGELILIDYKSGNPKEKNWYGERMDEPQLPLYCVTSSKPINAIAFAQINITATQFIGVGNLVVAHHGIAQTNRDWLEQIAEWNINLNKLAHEFIHGVTLLTFKNQTHLDYAKDLIPFNRLLEKRNTMLADGFIRQTALDPTQSFAVSAPAGSGKTGLLTQRILRLLSLCDEPEEVLAITFTRKAAGEMRNRLLAALADAEKISSPVTDAHSSLTKELAKKVLDRDHECSWNLLHNPQRLRIQTIDSLCRSITKQLPLASGIGAQPDTLTDHDLAYHLAVREFISNLEDQSPLSHQLAILLRHLDNNLQTIEKLLVALLAKREQWLGILLQARHEDARTYLENVLTTVIREHLEKLHHSLKNHASELCLIADQAANNLSKEEDPNAELIKLLGITSLPTTDPESLPLWQGLSHLPLTKEGNYRVKPNKNTGFPAGKSGTDLKLRFEQLIRTIEETNPEAKELLNAVRYLPSTDYSEQQWQLLNALTSILPVLVAQLSLVFKQLGATDYTAISQAALLALGDDDSPSELALKLDYRIRHILIDEFQDTSAPQFELIKKLTSGWQNGDGRTLFIVGDGMQSCYGFRDANVGLFLDARHYGIGSVVLTPLDLSVNFRSQEKIITWINSVFSKAFPPQEDISLGAVNYSPAVAFNPALAEEAVGVDIIAYVTDNNNEGIDNEQPNDNQIKDTKAIAKKIEAMRVVELIQKTQRADPEASIAVLVRSRKHLNEILPALSAAGLIYHATEIDSLADRMEIVDLMSLTKALLDPANRTAWLSVLRAPWCGLSNQDLLHLVTHANEDFRFPLVLQQLKKYEDIKDISIEGQTILKRVMNVISNALPEAYRKPLRQFIEGVWIALGGPATLVNSLVQKNQKQQNVERFFSVLETPDYAGGIKDWTSFHHSIEKLFAESSATADIKLHVMTIHKAKGLEFDTVIIPCLDRSTSKDDKQLFLWQERINRHSEKQLLLSSLAASGQEQDKIYQFMRLQADKQKHLEATRLLYVGCTRAIKQLYLLACFEIKQESLNEPAKNSLLHSIWPEIRGSVNLIQSTSQFSNSRIIETQVNKNSFDKIVRLTSPWQLPQLTDVNLLKNYRGHEFSSTLEENPLNLPEMDNETNRLSRHLGTFIHRILQSIVENQLITNERTLNEEEYIQHQSPFWQIALDNLGIYHSAAEHGLKKIIQVMKKILNHPEGRWLLNSDHEANACELAVIFREAEKSNDASFSEIALLTSLPRRDDIKTSIIDRTFIDNGIRWIIDYKSSEPSEGQTLTDFIEMETEKYLPQMQHYKMLMEKLDQHPIRCALYFTCTGQLQILENC